LIIRCLGRPRALYPVSQQDIHGRMKVVAIALVAILAVAHAAEVQTGASVTPIAKVIEMLQGMLAQGKKQKQDEQVMFAAYKQFCDDTIAEKTKAIADANAAIEELTADIQEYEADIAALTKSIQGHEADIATWTGDMKALKAVRAKERADYELTHKDYSESIDALERAIAVLKKARNNTGRVEQAAFAQLMNMDRVPSEVKHAILGFLAQDPETDDGFLTRGAPEAAGYEFQSTSVIEMLEKLETKFNDERTQLEKEEANARHAFEMLVQDLTNSIDTSTKARNENQEEKANKQQALADAKGDLADTIATRDEDTKYLTDLTSTCQLKANEFEQRQKLRGEELDALSQALEILSNSVSPLGAKHLPSFVQKTSFLQLKQRDVQHKVAAFLSASGKRINSHILSALAVRVSEDPFKKVKQMIKDLIVRLLEEANEEAEHKGWCDTELSTNEQTRKEKTNEVDTLNAEIDELSASIAQLAQDITDLTNAVAELEAALQQATEIRNAEHAKNTETIADAQEAQTAVAQALTILREFYSKAADATALVQQQQPEIWDEAYTGMQAEKGGVVGMLEVIQSDFARLETETEAAENEAQREYETFKQDTEVDKVAKNKDIEFKTTKKNDQEAAKQSKETDLADAQAALDAALAYYDKLKPSCVDAGVSYEDRVQRRKEEIESLQEALRILNGEDFAA